ncbi:Alpha/Beta hydrolase protein [Elsinoe ampelina]|uniref:Alpha/Beta hydrolase protein n=1 Tax=Elsinoe ampelina TaxID=302913 RepID=A0A6A6GJN0_9PEZI|nr:Alpha/Beta hydrolase protein [Elsinoe ampelina]
MADYTKLPSSAKVKPTPFTANIPEEKLQQMLQLAKLAPIAPEVYENVDTSRSFGMNRDWLIKARDHWVTKFDWRKHEKRINSFPNYQTEITDNGGSKWNIHFIALFSNKENAIPIGLYHGWPGSFLEFLDLLDIIKKQYTPDTLPYHIIVPSLPGYTFSSGPAIDKDATWAEMSDVPGKLMHALGFESGYVAQGGDLGSFVSRYLGGFDDSCKAWHVNCCIAPPPPGSDKIPIEQIEQDFLPKGKAWLDTGTAYGQEHGTRTATIGLVLSSSPVALLAWIGEKFLEWSDEDPPLDQILESISLYWLTDTFPRCIYPYRSLYGPDRQAIREKLTPKGDKTPMGYSYFPKELVAMPVAWAALTANMVWSNRHTSGGHFAAMEKPAELWSDIEEFVKAVWK